MKKIIPGALIFLLSMTVANAQSVHAVTFLQKNLSAGAKITLGGQKYAMVFVPVADFGSSNRYAVGFLTPEEGDPSAIFAYLETEHTNETLSNPVTISGFPGVIQVFDHRTYSITTNFLTTKNELDVVAGATSLVRVKIGATMLNFFVSIPTEQQTATPLADANQYSAVGKADWSKYIDPLTQITAVDNYIDYIRIIKIN